MVNILVDLKVWHAQWAGLRVLIKCDNQAVVGVLNNGKTCDRTLAKYARNIVLWLSACNIDIKVVHVAGRLNPVADLLSRWHITNHNFQNLQQMVHPVTWISTFKIYCMWMKQFKVVSCALYLCFIGQPLDVHLTQQATSRLSYAFAESTRKAYATLFRTFLAFVTFMCWDLHQVTVFNLLCFLECLHYNGVKHLQMSCQL